MWRYLAVHRIGAVILETLLLIGCVLGGYFIRLHYFPLAGPLNSLILPKSFLIALVFQLFLHLRDVYDLRKTLSMPEYFLKLGEALLFSSGVLWILYYIFPALLVGRGVYIISLVLISAFLLVWHALVRLYIRRRAPNTRLLVLGTGRLARDLVRQIIRRPELGMQVQGFVGDDPALVGVSLVNPKVVGLVAELPRLVKQHKADRIVVELQDRRGTLPFQDLLDFKTRGIAIEDATTVYEQVTGKIAIENLKPSWLIFNSGFRVSRSLLIQKRILSILVSTVLLILFAPVTLLLMVLIRLGSPGPIFHRQQRVGQDGCVFTLWKFRSMYEDAEADTGPVWAEKHDPRATPIGRFMRRTRLDELPQLYNVLVGNMSLVGPRPERPEFVTELSTGIPYYHLRHSVKPGITGWAQINYRYASSIAQTTEKLQYDLFYIKNMSMLLDALIVLETIKTVLVGQGS